MLKNAIVLMFDSLQHNYLGCYGNTWIKTPNMDRLAREGVLFENCYTEGLPTIPCRRAMHTGRYTLHETGWSPLRMEDTTIADLCWGRPIDTALIFDCPMYRQPKFGYTRGFDKVYFTHGHELDHYYYATDPLIHKKPMDYLEESTLAGIKKQYGQKVIDTQLEEIEDYLKQRQYWKSEEDRYVAKTIRKAIGYLEQVDRNKQFFLWIDSFDPHEPWDPPSVYLNFPCPYDPDYKGKDEFLPILGDCDGVYTEPQLHHIRMLYAELVTLCDKYLGILLDAVRKFGFEESTLFMMVSDHGEPLGYGEHGHGIMRKVRPWPYEELVHTPMLLRAPGIKAGQRIKAFVQSCDVAPTVCDWLGIGVHPDMQGFSLLPLCRGEKEKVRDFAIAGYYKSSAAIYTEDWSYIHWTASDKADMSFMEDLHGNMEENSEYLHDTGGKSLSDAADMIDMDAFTKHKKTATIDGQEMWTCTPGSAIIVPEEDELYDRKKDPFQLHNLIKQHPKVGEELYKKLREFMNGLSAR